MKGIIAKFWLFCPQIVVLLCIGLVGYLIVKLIYWKIGKDKYNDQEWVQNNKKKAVIPYFLIILICAPALEEVVFRLPLIIFFDSLSSLSWIFIVLSSALFSFYHNKNALIYAVSRKRSKVYKENKTNLSPEEAEQSLDHDEKKEMKFQKYFIHVSTFLMGVIAAYFGIKYQSLYLTALIHFIWNFFMGTGIFSLILVLLISVLLYIVFLPKMIFDKWECYRYKKMADKEKC